jgi:hypothetical protein
MFLQFQADNFSGFQMERLIKRSRMQKTLETVGKQLGEVKASAVDIDLVKLELPLIQIG